MLADQSDIVCGHEHSHVCPAGRGLGFRVKIYGLPTTASRQDLEHHMRRSGDILFADLDHDGVGVVEFAYEEDMHSAVCRLDDTEFKNQFHKSYIRVRYANQYDQDRDDSRGKDQRSGRHSSNSRDNKRDHDRRRLRNDVDDDDRDWEKSRRNSFDDKNKDSSSRRRRNKDTNETRDEDKNVAKQSLKGDEINER